MSTANQITPRGKALAGALLILFTITPIVLIIGLWPDQMPGDAKNQTYQFVLFNVKLLGEGDTYKGNIIHINNILFMLVALSGFMGSMIHLATSLTNYVGSEKFCKSWILWYTVKPFTAAALAIIFYLVLQAGLLNFGDAGNINPYGVVILAALTGLFTDKATLKLEEIFEVVFKPRDVRPDKLEREGSGTDGAINVSGVQPEQLSLSGENKIVISGKGFNKTLKITMDEEEITDALITSEAISFNYKTDPEQEKKELELSVKNEQGKKLHSAKLPIETIDVPETEEEPVG